MMYGVLHQRSVLGVGVLEYSRDGVLEYSRDGVREYSRDGVWEYSRDGVREYSGNGGRKLCPLTITVKLETRLGENTAYDNLVMK